MPIQVLNFPLAEGATYNPYRRSTLEEILSGVGGLLGNIEAERQRRYQQAIIGNILRGNKPDEWLPKYQEPTPAKSLLGRIMQGVGGMFDINRPPASITPIEQAIAEAKLKEKINKEKDVYIMDPITGETRQTSKVPYRSIVMKGVLSPKQIEERALSQGRAAGIIQGEKDIAVLNVKRKVLARDLERFFNIDDVLQEARAKGAERFGSGIKMTWEGITRNTPLGQAVAAHEGAVKRLRVQLVRAAGDVGNINIVEQEAAEKLIPTKWDDYETASLKRAYLQELTRAINDNDGNMVRDILEELNVKFIKKEDVEFTARKYGITTDEVIKRLTGGK